MAKLLINDNNRVLVGSNGKAYAVTNLDAARWSGSPVTLEAAAGSVLKLLRYGKVEQEGTPTPSDPQDIVCNNGAIKLRHQSGLPAQYDRLTYLESSGTQIVNTGYVPQETDSIEVDYALQDLTRSGDKMIVGQEAITNMSGMWVETYGNTNRWYVRFGSTASANAVYNSSQASGTFIIKKNSFAVNGTEVATPTYVSMNPNPLTLFHRINAGGVVSTIGASVRLSEVRIKDNNGEIIHKYIPVRRTDNVLGMYDTVSGQFFSNAGSGTFTAGSVVTDPLVTYIDGTPEVITLGLHSASAVDLFAVGDCKDEQDIISGKVTRRCGVCVYDGTQTIGNTYISTTGGLDVGAIIIYPLAAETTEQVTAQPLNTVAGQNTVTDTAEVSNPEHYIIYRT